MSDNPYKRKQNCDTDSAKQKVTKE